MININWGERPTDKHCWLESMRGSDSNESGWYTLEGSSWTHKNKAEWYAAGERVDFTVHRKPIEPYNSLVGEWCDYRTESKGEYRKAFFIGYNEDGEHVLKDTQGDFIEDVCNFRPIKTEREQFIEKSVELAGGAEESVRYGIQYDNGARFKGPDKQLD